MATSGTIREVTTVATSVRRVAVEDLAAHLATLEAELSEGKAIEVMRGDKVIAELRGKTAVTVPLSRPDVAAMKARLRATWGDTVLPSGTMTEVVRNDRDGRG